MKSNKLGDYIEKLMSVIIDNQQDSFLRELSFNELKKINHNIEEFIKKYNTQFDGIEKKEKDPNQMLLFD